MITRDDEPETTSDAEEGETFEDYAARLDAEEQEADAKPSRRRAVEKADWRVLESFDPNLGVL